MTPRTLLAVALGVPTLVAALGMAGVELWRVTQPSSPLVAPPAPPSLAAAIEWGELWQVHELLAARPDPWAPFDVRHPAVTGDRLVQVSPLLWAVAVRNEDAVRLLVGLDAPVVQPADARAACLADALGADGLAEVLRTYAPAFALPCPPLDTTGPPLPIRVLDAGAGPGAP